MRTLTHSFFPLFCVLLVSAVTVRAVSANPGPATEYQVTTFRADVTIPVGHACMGGGIANAKEILDPLFALGFVLLGNDKPVVVCSVDWCQLNNDAFDLWRDILADAAGTDRKHVLLATVHQHDAPICDLRAQAILDDAGLRNSICDAAFCEKAARDTARALTESLKSPRRVTHLGVGQAVVEKLASNRRVATSDGKIRWDRTSADRKFDAQPEGEIDPALRTLSLWDGDTPVLAWHCYAVHPMSYYGKGQVSADFVGMARGRRQGDDKSVFQIYFSGCAGDTTCGKYNDGRPEDRPLLADRLYEAMTSAWRQTKRAPLKQVAFRSAELRLPVRDGGDFSPDAMKRILADPKESRWRRNCAAMGLSWRGRSDRPIDVPCLDFGDAQFAVMPAETFVGYALAAQRARPNQFVMVAGYGDGAPGYIPTAACWADGYEDHYCWVARESAAAMTKTLEQALGAKGTGR